MATTSPASPPSHVLALLLWLSTLAGGTVLLATKLLLFNPEHLLSDALIIPLYISFFAAVLSLPTLCILPFGMRWVFRTTATPSQWKRLLLLISGLFGLGAGGGYLYSASVNFLHKEIVYFMLPYLPAAILAAIIIYRSWLFRS